MSEELVVVSARVPRALLEQIQRAAQKRNVALSDIVRQALVTETRRFGDVRRDDVATINRRRWEKKQ
jgi:hypothetical protein